MAVQGTEKIWTRKIFLTSAIPCGIIEGKFNLLRFRISGDTILVAFLVAFFENESQYQKHGVNEVIADYFRFLLADGKSTIYILHASDIYRNVSLASFR